MGPSAIAASPARIRGAAGSPERRTVSVRKSSSTRPRRSSAVARRGPPPARTRPSPPAPPRRPGAGDPPPPRAVRRRVEVVVPGGADGPGPPADRGGPVQRLHHVQRDERERLPRRGGQGRGHVRKRG